MQAREVTAMVQSIPESNESDSSAKPTGEELATRLFSLVMFGVCATILFMIIMGDW
jgi:hypothetical protein